ncbi:MAG: PKD domain-containing protein [Thermoplasmata archaeon]|nr:PKD domain-containing protein [Thermoplasmata archaeon]
MRYSKTAIFLSLLLLLMPVLVNNSSSAEPTRDEDGNDDFSTAQEIAEISVDPIEGDLTSEDTDDYFKLVNRESDNLHYQRNGERVTIALIKDSGAELKAYIYDPNQLLFATLDTSQSRSQIDFVIPYTGDYYIKVETNPRGQTSSYLIMLGGDQTYDNSPPSGGYDKNNDPGSQVYDTTSKFSTTLNPVLDIVDFMQFVLEPEMGLELDFQSASPLKVQLQSVDLSIMDESDPYGIIEYRNEGSQTVTLNVRVFYPLDGSVDYSDNFYAMYVLHAEIWSFNTIPEVDPADPWSGGIIMDEDQAEDTIPILNLTRHFFEENGDPIQFLHLSTPEHVTVNVQNITLGSLILWVEVSFVPEPNWNGIETLEFEAYDRDGSVSDTIDITVRSVNDLPLISFLGGIEVHGGSFAIGIDEDILKSYEVVYSDVDDPIEMLTFETNESISFLDVNRDNGTISISPIQQDVGTYFMSLVLKDPNMGTDTVNISVTVEPVNEVPPQPSITIIRGNHTDLMPDEELELECIVGPDPDGDDLTYTWEMGDGTTLTGSTVVHAYPGDKSGDRVITLTVSDGYLTSKATLKAFVQSPEDIAVGDLSKVISDPLKDVVKFHEAWKLDKDDQRDFTVFTTEVYGVDIISISCLRRVNTLEISLKVSHSIEADGSYSYEVFILSNDHSEIDPDLKNVSSWDTIPSRLPSSEEIYAQRGYYGSLDNRSHGALTGLNTLVFIIPFSELNQNGMEYPLSADDFSLFAVVSHTTTYYENKGLAERYVLSDSAGEGALEVGVLASDVTSSGDGSSPFGEGDISKNWPVLIAMLLGILVLGGVSAYFVIKLRKEKTQKEKEFQEYVDDMKEGGKDLFGKEAKKEIEVVSFEELYGSKPPEDYNDTKGEVIGSLPKPGLGGDIQDTQHITETKIGPNDGEDEKK